MSKPGLELIEWVDSALDRHGWKSLDEITARAPIVRSVGFVVRETAEQIVLMPHLVEAQEGIEGQGCGEMTIPVVAIRTRAKLTSSSTSRPGRPSRSSR